MARVSYVTKPTAQEQRDEPRHRDSTESNYPRLSATPTSADLREYFVPTVEEVALSREVAKSSNNPMAHVLFLLHLKSFATLGYFLTVTKIPKPIRTTICRAVKSRALRASDLTSYANSKLEATHLRRIRELTNVQVLDAQGRAWLRSFAEATATTKHYVGDILSVLVEELVRRRYELPALRTLQDIVAGARESVYNTYYANISGALTPETRALVDALFTSPAGPTFSGWQILKREPRKPTHKEIRSYLAHIERLKGLVDKLPPVDLPPRKLEDFRDQARASDATEMAKFKADKRYALAVVFIRHQYSKVLDDSADLFTRMVSKVRNKAERARLDYQIQQRERTEALVRQLDAMLEAFDTPGSSKARLEAIAKSLKDEVAVLRTRCREFLSLSGPNYQPFVLHPYAGARPLLLDCLELMGLKSSSDDLTTERMIDVVLKHRNVRGRGAMDPQILGLDIATDLDWLSTTWRSFVIVKKKGEPPKIHRTYFELAVITTVEEEVRAGDLHIPDGDRYDDYREELVDNDVLDEELTTYGEKAGISCDPDEYVAALQGRLSDSMQLLDKELPGNPDASIVNGRLKLTRADAPVKDPGIQELDNLIRERMPEVAITDVLIDCTRLLNLSRFFRHVGGQATRLEDIEYRIVTTLLCYGCFIGARQTERAVRGLSRKQPAWLNVKYVNEKSLQRASEAAMNKYIEYELTTYWGSIKSAAADGTKWALYEENLISTYHIRHGGYGGLVYCHVSGNYMAIITHFTPCGVHEGNYILDVLENASRVQPTELHGDTNSQSYTIFGLAPVLGFELMPRIRSVNDCRLFRADAKAKYPHIKEIVEKDPIDWQLIKTHYRDILRVAVSIKLGKMTPSTVLRRLGTHSRKNKLYFALRELGRVHRTMFLCRYIGSLSLRQQIHAACNKTEAFHEFAKKLAFGNGGVIADNLRHEQVKVIRYNKLVANMVILHNVEHMSRVLEALRKEGREIDEKHLAGLAPYRFEHLNLLGAYDVDMGRPVETFDSGRVILPKPQKAS